MTHLELPQRTWLIELAEQTIRNGAARNTSGPPTIAHDELPLWARTPAATFVTVYVDGTLNGCVGTLMPVRPLAEDIVTNAYRAAFEDPRFTGVTANDLADLFVHVAILGPLEPLTVDDERDLLEQIRVGVDGVVLDDGDRRGTFLPAVWAKLPDPRAFLGQLKRKAGFADDEWPATLQTYRFSVDEFDRSDLSETDERREKR